MCDCPHCRELLRAELALGPGHPGWAGARPCPSSPQCWLSPSGTGLWTRCHSPSGPWAQASHCLVRDRSLPRKWQRCRKKGEMLASGESSILMCRSLSLSSTKLNRRKAQEIRQIRTQPPHPHQSEPCAQQTGPHGRDAEDK